LNIFELLVTDPILNLLILLYNVLFSNFGLAIIALTFVLKIITIPLSTPSIKMAKKQKEIAPELKELKDKYGKDKKLMAQKQMELYQKHGINPASGCLPQILQIVIIFSLYNVFIKVLSPEMGGINYINENVYFNFLKFTQGTTLNTSFLYLDLSLPDKTLILPILAAVAQFISSKMLMPQTQAMLDSSKETEGKSDDFMYNMQKQMVFMAPIMTILVGIRFASGLVLYWFVSTLLASATQFILTKRMESDKKLDH